MSLIVLAGITAARLREPHVIHEVENDFTG